MNDVAPSNSIRRYIALLFQAGDVFEVRALDCRERNSRYTFTCSGYFAFDAIDVAVREVAALDESGIAPAIYVTLNPVAPALLARSLNRIKTRARETTADKDIVCRRWLLIDVDPVRPAGVSSTDAELALAFRRAESIREHLATLKWPAPIMSMSGNGYHLLYRIDLPANDDGLIKAVLSALSDRFTDDAVVVDRSVHNPARIVKVAGTMSRKGDDLHGIAGLDDRPHRRAELINIPDPIAIVTADQLAAVANAATVAPDAPQANVAAPVANGDANGERFDATVAGVRAWLEAHGVAVKSERRNGDKTLLCLERCPINPEIQSSGGSDIAVVVFDDGKLAYCNKHNRGQTFTWHDLRRAVDPDYSSAANNDNDVDLSGLNIAPCEPSIAPVHPIQVPEVEPVLVCVADVEPEMVRWLWPGRIAMGKLTLLCGDPGLGKSFLAIDLTARLTSGAGWPDIPLLKNEPGGVVLLSAEDDLADTIRPRLDACGADPTRIVSLQAVRRVRAGKTEETYFDLNEDLPALVTAIQQTPDCKLVVIDPVTAYLGNTDSHKNAEVRAVLARLFELASQQKVAILAVTHLNKASTLPAIYRAMGSLAFVAAARAVWAVMRDQNDQTGRRRLFLPIKNNLGADETGLAYALEPAGHTARLIWEPDPVTVRADDALNGGGSRTALVQHDAQLFIIDTIKSNGGDMLSDELWDAAKESGISKMTFRRAKQTIVAAYKEPGRGGHWHCKLKDAQDAHDQSDEHI